MVGLRLWAYGLTIFRQTLADQITIFLSGSSTRRPMVTSCGLDPVTSCVVVCSQQPGSDLEVLQGVEGVAGVPEVIATVVTPVELAQADVDRFGSGLVYGSNRRIAGLLLCIEAHRLAGDIQSPRPWIEADV